MSHNPMGPHGLLQRYLYLSLYFLCSCVWCSVCPHVHSNKTKAHPKKTSTWNLVYHCELIKETSQSTQNTGYIMNWKKYERKWWWSILRHKIREPRKTQNTSPRIVKSQLRFEPGSSQIQVRSVTLQPTYLVYSCINVQHSYTGFLWRH
jgi:hypothetical protein